MSELFAIEKPRAGGPRVSSGKDSVQVVGTPWEFIHAVEKRWGRIAVDLAATKENAKADVWISPERNSLTVDWHTLEGNLWLNPEFSDIAPWAEKCCKEAQSRANIYLLVPASIDSNWWDSFVHNRALVYPLVPRLKFEGHKDVYPKPLTLVRYADGQFGYPGRWRWK